MLFMVDPDRRQLLRLLGLSSRLVESAHIPQHGDNGLLTGGLVDIRPALS